MIRYHAWSSLLSSGLRSGWDQIAADVTDARPAIYFGDYPQSDWPLVIAAWTAAELLDFQTRPARHVILTLHRGGDLSATAAAGRVLCSETARRWPVEDLVRRRMWWHQLCRSTTVTISRKGHRRRDMMSVVAEAAMSLDGCLGRSSAAVSSGGSPPISMLSGGWRVHSFCTRISAACDAFGLRHYAFKILVRDHALGY